MKAARVIVLVGFYLLFVALVGYWIFQQEPRPSLPTRTRPPAVR